MVIVFTGLFTDYRRGQGWVYPQDDQIAAVLGHENYSVNVTGVQFR